MTIRAAKIRSRLSATSSPDSPHPDRATIIEDRAAAIAWTIEQAADADVILIAGKGHEDYQESRGKRVPFSDYAVAAALSAQGRRTMIATLSQAAEPCKARCTATIGSSMA